MDKPDPLRCQTEITITNPWTLGGIASKTNRCTNKPTVIATEKKPGKDGQRGAMSLCAGCLVQFRKAMPAGYATVRAISSKRKRASHG